MQVYIMRRPRVSAHVHDRPTAGAITHPVELRTGSWRNLWRIFAESMIRGILCPRIVPPLRVTRYESLKPKCEFVGEIGSPHWTISATGSSEKRREVGDSEHRPRSFTGPSQKWLCQRSCDLYSVRKASRGLRRAPRRAGSQHASSATVNNSTVVAANTAGSCALTP